MSILGEELECHLLAYEPRIEDLAELLCDELGAGYVLVCPVRVAKDTFSCGDVWETCVLETLSRVAAFVRGVMVPVPLLGFVLDASVMSDAAAAGEPVDPFKFLEKVRAVVAGVFDGESFVVYPVVDTADHMLSENSWE